MRARQPHMSTTRTCTPHTTLPPRATHLPHCHRAAFLHLPRTPCLPTSRTSSPAHAHHLACFYTYLFYPTPPACPAHVRNMAPCHHHSVHHPIRPPPRQQRSVAYTRAAFPPPCPFHSTHAPRRAIGAFSCRQRLPVHYMDTAAVTSASAWHHAATLLTTYDATRAFAPVRRAGIWTDVTFCHGRYKL